MLVKINKMIKTVTTCGYIIDISFDIQTHAYTHLKNNYGTALYNNWNISF